MKLKTNEKEEKKQNFKTSVKCIKLLITSIAMLVLIAMFIMLIIATHSIENTEQKIVDVVENKILGDTKSASVGNNITAIFDSTTGFVTISTTGVDTDTPTLDKDSLFSFYQQCGYDNITEITVQNYIYAPVDSSDLFKGLSQLKSVHNINHLYMNNVTNVSNMFSDCISLDSLNMSEWNMTNVVNTTGMLNRCIFLKLINTPQPSQCPQQDVQLPTMFYNQADETEQREGGTYIIGGAKATFTQETGELKISNRFNTYDKFNGHTFQQSVNLVVGTIDADSLIALYDEKGHENITTITFEDHVYAPASSSGLFKNLSNLTTVNNAKNFDVSNSERMWEFFSGCSSLTSLDVSGWNTEKVTDMSYLFNGCSSLTELEVEEWDTANCKKMDYMFSGCTGLTTIDISKWTMDNVSIIHSMFSGCTNLTTLNVSQWNIGNVTDIGSVFRDCENLQSIDVENWKTQNVEDMSYAFNGCKKLTTIGIDNWDTGKVLNFDRMFMNCEKVTALNVGSWNVSKAQNMEAMFYHCELITELNVSEWQTGEVTTMAYMFDGCTNLQTLDVRNWNTGKVKLMYQMFYECGNLTAVDVSQWNTGEVTDIHAMFFKCGSLQELDVSSWDTKNVTNMHNTFARVTKVPVLEVGEWSTAKVTDMHDMFYHCDNITELHVGDWQTGEVTDMHEMFGNCAKLQELDVSVWNTEKVTDMNRMFYNDKKLPTLNVSGWETGKVTDMHSMFYHCDLLPELQVDNWKTGEVTDMNEMFYSCQALTVLNVSTWDTQKVTNMKNMFYKCSDISELDVQNFDTHLVTDMYGMFYYCEELTELNMCNWDMSSVTDTTDMLYKDNALTDIYTPQEYSEQTIEIPTEGKRWYNVDNEEDSNIYSQFSSNTFENSVHLTLLVDYNIHYNLDNGSVSPANPGTYNALEKFTLHNPTKEKYTFIGWTEGEEQEPQEVVEVNGREHKGELTYTAHYLNNIHTVTFKDGDDKQEQQQVEHGQSATPPDWKKDGYTLTWDAEFENVTQDMVVNAVWVAQGNTQYKVYHYKQNKTLDGYEEADVEVKQGQTDTQAIAEPKEYTGFEENKQYGERVDKGNITGDGNLILKLYYDRKKYNVTLNPNQGTIKEGDITQYVYGVEKELPTDVTREGYTFEGWYEDENFDGEEKTKITDTDTDDKIFYAKWTPKGDIKYVVKHWQQKLEGHIEPKNDTNYDLVYESQDLKGTTGEEVTPPVEEYDGFVSPNAQTVAISADGSTVINYYYTRRTDLSYTVKYIDNDSQTDIEDEKVVPGQTFGSEITTNNEIKTIDEYDFVSINPEDKLTITTGENIITVYYTKKEASVTVHHYIYDGDEGGNTTTRLVDDVVISGKVGDGYTATVSNMIPANYICKDTQPENYTGNLTEAGIEVSFYYELIRPTIQNNMQISATADEVDEDGISVLTRENGVVTYNISYTVNIKDYIGNAKVEIEVQLPTGINTDKSELTNGIYTESTHTIKWVEMINDINSFTQQENQTFTKEITKQIQVVYEGQDVIRDLVTKVDGKITTYYPTDYLTKGGEKLVEQATEERITVKQNHKVNFKVVKVWDDNNNSRGKRPESVTIVVRIMPNDQTITKVLNAQNNWTYEETTLPKYNNITGEKIEYIVTETETQTDDLQFYNEADIQKTETETDEGTKYTYLVTNSYKLKNADFNTHISKVGPNEITNKDEKVNYTINFNSEISNYIGDGKVTIVDTLPFPIDEDNSALDGGDYDEDTNTITWVENLKNINTDKLGESHKIHIEKQIAVLYKEMDLSQDKITNEVKGKIELDSSDEIDVESTGADTSFNVQGKVVVKYIDIDTNEEIKYTEENEEGQVEEKVYGYEITGKVGTEYTTQQKEIEGYEYTEILGDETGVIKEKQQEIIYYYRKLPKITVTVKYVDIDTQKDIIGASSANQAEEIYNYEITGNLGEEYETILKDIPYYIFANSTKNTKGKLTKEDTVIYYYRKQIFNFSIDKTLTGVTLNGEPINVKDKKLAKVELKTQEVDKTEIIVNYTIKVTNEGELLGTVKVLDTLPKGFETVELPEYWQEKDDGTLETDVELDIGQSKELNLTLKWVNSEENLGTKSNKAELIGGNNIANYDDTNEKDDTSEATIVISIKTGVEINKMIIIMTIIVIVLIGYLVLMIIRTFSND